MHQHKVVGQLAGAVYGSLQRTVVAVVVGGELSVVELIEAAFAAGIDVVGDGGVDIEAVHVVVVVAGDAADIVLVDLPLVVGEHLHGAGAVVRQARGEESAAGVERAVDELHVVEIVVFRSAWLQRAHQLEQFGVESGGLRGVLPYPAPVVRVEQVGGGAGAVEAPLLRGGIEESVADIRVVDVEPQVVGVADGGVGHVELQDAERRAQIGVAAVDVDAVDRLVVGHRLVVVGGDIGHRPVVVEQVDVVVGVDDEQPVGGLAPFDMRYLRVAQRVHLVVGLQALVVLVVREEVLAGQHIDHIAGFLDFGHVVISHVGPPRARLGMAQEGSQQDDECDGFAHIYVCFMVVVSEIPPVSARPLRGVRYGF